MNRAEAELLSGSVDSFTNSIMRRKMLDEQRAERAQREILQREAMGRQDYQFGEQMKRGDTRMAQDKEYRDASLGLQKEESAARAGDRKADAEYRDKNLKMQESIRSIQEGIRKDANATRQLDQLNSTFANIERGVQSGTISPEEGNRQAAAIYQSMKDSFEAMIGLTPFAAFANGQDVQLFKAPPVKPEKPVEEPVVEEVTTVNKKNMGNTEERTTRKLTQKDVDARGRDQAIKAAMLKRDIGERRKDPKMVMEAERELEQLGQKQATPAAPGKSRFQINVVK